MSEIVCKTLSFQCQVFLNCAVSRWCNHLANLNQHGEASQEWGIVQEGAVFTVTVSNTVIILFNAYKSLEALLQDTMHLIQRPCYQLGSPCQDPAGNRTTLRPPDHGKETQTAVVLSCLPFIRCGQNHLAGHSEREKKTRLTEEEVGRQHHWSLPSPRGQWLSLIHI